MKIYDLRNPIGNPKRPASLQRKHRKSLFSIKTFLITTFGLMLLWAVAPFSSLLIDSLFHPWAHAWTGRPIIVGDWVGHMDIEGEKPINVQLTLWRHSLLNFHYPEESSFEGMGYFSDESGKFGEYKIFGRSDRNAEVITIRLEGTLHISASHKEAVLQEWTGTLRNGTLSFEGQCSWRRSDGTSSTISSTAANNRVRVSLKHLANGRG